MLKNILLKFIKFSSRFIRKDKKLITFLFKGYSGSNISPLLDEVENDTFMDYKIKVIRLNSVNLSHDEKYKKIRLIYERIHLYKYLMISQLVISTHGSSRIRHDNKMLNLWHGIPMKSMSLMNKMKNDEVFAIKDDVFLSTSDFYNTVMNSCLGIRAEKYFITGYPRNDYLFNQNGIENLELLINSKIDKKVLLFMPTYSDNKDNKETKKTLFGFEEFDIMEFNGFLEKWNLILLLKLHPNEENFFMENYSKYVNDNIILITTEMLEENKMDFYKIVNAVDLLITDYSSIYFDYLLLNKPIIFTPVDYEGYKKKRGFLLEPYNFWAPGPVCIEQKLLQEEVVNCLNNETYYKKERENIKNIFHKYQTGNSTERVVNLIKEMMKS